MKNFNLNSLMGELPALQESAEGKLKGGFASFSVSMLSADDGGNTECTGNENCSGNKVCSNNRRCYNNTGCKDEKNDFCTPPPTTTPKPTPEKGQGGNSIFSSLMF